MTDLPPPPTAAPPGAKRKKETSFFRELPVLILIAFALALLIKTLFVQAFFIPSESMVPTLLVKDRVLVNKLVYRFRDPRRGEIIVFVGEEEIAQKKSFLQKVRSFLTDGLGVAAPAEKDFIKRVIGLPGEKISIAKGKVSITPPGGKRFVLKEPYIAKEPDLAAFGPFTVPKDSYFVMGDNRPSSADSRTRLGPIPKKRIVGKAFIRIWPLGRVDFFHRPLYDTDPAEKTKQGAPLRQGAEATSFAVLAGGMAVLPGVWGGVYPGRRGARRSDRAAAARRGIQARRRRR